MDHISKHLQVQKQDVAISTNRPALPTEAERQLDKSLQERRLCEVGEEGLKPNLLYVYTLIGLRGENYPKGLDKDFLHTYILENYGGHTGAEIRLAFTMAIQGKLDLEEKDITCYENFSTLYFSRIMSAYRGWAAEAVKHLPKKAEEMPALPPVQTTDEEFIQAVLTVYRLNRDYKAIPLLAYKVLEAKMGLTRADKQRIYQRVHETTQSGDLKELAMQYAVKEYFDKLIADENRK
jgi:hypothetical protein